MLACLSVSLHYAIMKVFFSRKLANTMAQAAQLFSDSLRMKAIARNMAYILFDRNHKVVEVNDSFAKALGYTKDELIGLNHSALCFPIFTKSDAYHIFWQKLLNGEHFQDKIERRSKEGASVWLEATYMPVLNETDEQIIGVLKIATDITAREQHVKRLAGSLKDMAAELKEQSYEGNQQNEALSTEMKKIVDYSATNREKLNELQANVKKINGFTEIIRQIAEETQILAFNASIEGARVGEAGRGFAVIAKQMQVLSDKVSESIHSVRDQAESIISSVSQITEDTKTLSHDITVSQSNVAATLQAFTDITGAAQALDDQAQLFEQII